MNLKKMIAPKGWKNLLLKLSFGAALGLTTVIILFTVGKQYSKAKWEAQRTELVAKETPMTFNDLLPAPVADVDNFAKTPLFDGVFDKNGAEKNGFLKKLTVFEKLKKQPSLGSYQKGEKVNLEEWAKQFDVTSISEKIAEFKPEMAEITKLMENPNGRFQIAKEADNILATSGVYVGYLKAATSVSKLYCLRGLDAINHGNPDQAFSDAQTIIRIANSIKYDPFLINQLVVFSIRSFAYQIIWEGMQQRQWSNEHLTAFQNELLKVNALAELQLGLQGERIYSTTVIEVLLTAPTNPKKSPEDFSVFYNHIERSPKTWVYSSLIHLNTWYDNWLANIDPSAGRIQLNEMQIPPKKGPFWMNMDRAIADMVIPDFQKIALKATTLQTTSDQALIACSLERFYLKNNTYPETLEALIPEFLSKIPHDVASGEPFRYTRTPEGRFTLNAPVWERDGKTGSVQKSLTKEIVWKFE